MSSKLTNNNNLWTAINFVFPKWRRKGEKNISKFIKYKVFVDEQPVGLVDHTSADTFLANVKVKCCINILRVNTDPKNESILSNFLFIVGDDFATLYINKDNHKRVQLDFANQNRLEVLDDRDYQFCKQI